MSELQKYNWSDQHGSLLRDDAIEVHPLEGTSFYKAWSVDAARAADKARIEELQSSTDKLIADNAEYAKRHLEQLESIKLLQRALQWCLKNGEVLAARYDSRIDELVNEVSLLQRAVEWLYGLPELLVGNDGERYLLHCATEVQRATWVEIPAEFADIITAVKP